MSDAPHPTDVRVGRLLRERRLALGISQERLGALLGVTYQQVQKYERGANRIGSSRLGELCGPCRRCVPRCASISPMGRGSGGSSIRSNAASTFTRPPTTSAAWRIQSQSPAIPYCRVLLSNRGGCGSSPHALPIRIARSGFRLRQSPAALMAHPLLASGAFDFPVPRR